MSLPTIKSGFTLVELSIALVIIGLLIGGLLVGQSLIDSSKVNATAQQMGQYDAAVGVFKSKYKYLPGDSPHFGGNGDGFIEGRNLQLAVFEGEMIFFWNNLFPAKYNGITVTLGLPPVTTGSGANTPAALIGSNKAFVVATARAGSNTQNPDTANPSNYYSIMDRRQAGLLSGGYYYRSSNAISAALLTTEMLGLDRKMDDGLADSGYVLSGSVNNPGGFSVGGICAVAEAACSTGAIYATGTSGYRCTPLIRIGGQTGNPL